MINGSKIILSVLGAMCVFTIAGCKNKIDISAYSENTLALNSDGSVTELSVEDFEESYYSQSDLEEYIRQEVDIYNSQQASDLLEGEEAEAVITVDQVQVADGRARVVLTYEDLEDYAAFNYAQIQTEDGTALTEENAQRDFVNVKDESKVSLSSIENLEDYRAVTVYGPITIVVPGKIAYVSSNITSWDGASASCPDGESVILYR